MSGLEEIQPTDTATDLMLIRVFGVAKLLALVYEQRDTTQIGVENHLENRRAPDLRYREDEPTTQQG